MVCHTAQANLLIVTDARSLPSRPSSDPREQRPSLLNRRYRSCATFFVQGEVLLRHSTADYARVEQVGRAPLKPLRRRAVSLLSRPLWVSSPENRRWHPRAQNLIANCKRERELFPPNYPTPMARLMEGSWHLMLANVTRVPPPPYCPLTGGNKGQPRWSNSLQNRHYLQQRLEHPGGGGGANRTAHKEQRQLDHPGGGADRTAHKEQRLEAAAKGEIGIGKLDRTEQTALANGLQALKPMLEQVLGLLNKAGGRGTSGSRK